MKYQSIRMTHVDGRMHHLGVKEEHISKNVILTSDPNMVNYYASLMDDAVMQGDYREYVTYKGTYKGKELTVMSCGFGCMPMAIAVEELKHIGGENVILINENVAVNEDLKCGELIAAKGAVRSEGASREYIDISYPAVANMKLLRKLISQKVKIGLFRSHDMSNLDSPYAFDGMERINRWKKLGVDVFDSETSSMYVVGSCLKMNVASLSLISENYITGDSLSESELDEGRKKMFKVAAEALSE